MKKIRFTVAEVTQQVRIHVWKNVRVNISDAIFDTISQDTILNIHFMDRRELPDLTVNSALKVFKLWRD